MGKSSALVFGVAALDAIFHLREFPAEGSSQHAESAVWQAGGLARHAAVLASRFHVDAVVPLADDLAGLFMQEWMSAHDIDLHLITCSSSAVSFIISGDDRTIVTRRAEWEDDIPFPRDTSYDLIFSDSNHGPAFSRAVGELQPAWSCVDVGQRNKAGLIDAVRAARLVVGHANVMCELTATDSFDEAAEALFGFGVEVVVETLGAAGAHGRTAEGEVVVVDAPPVDVVDTTGCGDVFVSVLMANLFDGDSVSGAVAAGVGAASRWAGTSDERTLREFLAAD